MKEPGLEKQEEDERKKAILSQQENGSKDGKKDLETAGSS